MVLAIFNKLNLRGRFKATHVLVDLHDELDKVHNPQAEN